ncbi:hypothetical protein LMG33818_001554 [Halomonadaceae bacterium LMG 33818]
MRYVSEYLLHSEFLSESLIHGAVSYGVFIIMLTACLLIACFKWLFPKQFHRLISGRLSRYAANIMPRVDALCTFVASRRRRVIKVCQSLWRFLYSLKVSTHLHMLLRQWVLFMARGKGMVVLAVVVASLNGIAPANAVAAVLPGEGNIIETAFGDVQVPASPKRIVTLYEAALDTVVAVGSHPIGAVATRGGKSVATYLRKDTERVAIVGTPREINLERVLGLKPDLILASPYTQPELYRRLSRIAPTIVPPRIVDDPFAPGYWRKEALLFASALGKSVQINDVFRQLDLRIQHIKVQLGAQTKLPLVLIRWLPQGAVVMSDRVFAGELVRQLGFPSFPLARQMMRQPHSDVIGLEHLKQVDHGWIVLATLNHQGESALGRARLHPAMKRLEAVRKGRVIAVDGSLWTSAAGPLAANAILDDLENKMVLPRPSEVPG